MTDILANTGCCVIVPTYNNAQTIRQVIDNLLEYTQQIVVVNDGSVDKTPDILRGYDMIHVTGYSKNRGKGVALRTGFKKAVELGYTHAITIDSDGQHLASDLPKFAEQLKTYPNAIIIGARNMTVDNVPAKSSFGNRFSNFWVKVETGFDLPDTQSGYRLYPIKALNDIRFFSRKYEFEIEVLAKAAWAGIELMCIPIEVYYPPQEERISHFRPFKDFTRISILNTILVTLAFAWYWPRNIVRRYRKKGFRQVIREDVLGSNESNFKIALAIGYGIFMGIVPIWGYQLLVGFALAHLLKINKAIFFVFANISLPPMIPFILYLSYATGGMLLNQEAWQLSLPDTFTFETVWQDLEQYLIGAVAFATVAGMVFFLGSFAILSIMRKGK